MIINMQKNSVSKQNENLGKMNEMVEELMHDLERSRTTISNETAKVRQALCMRLEKAVE
jgi:flagellin-specific chaperone FliS